MSQDPIYRTSGERTGKMLAIILGICVVGGAIFFGMWDYWISSPAPVVAMKGGAEPEAPSVVETGVEIPVELSFIESSDFRNLAFNALPGEPGNNPTIEANVGDKIIFDVVNDGVSFHAFGVTAEESGFSGVIPGSAIASASNPLKSGESGASEFIPPEEGVYYYICTVPGHREQGMVGKIIVGDVSDISETSMAVPAPGHEDVPEMIVTKEPEPEPAVTVTPPRVETPPDAMGPFTGVISVPEGSGVPGCDATNECYIPAQISVNVGDTVTWSNDDTAAHTVTSGNPSDGPDGTFDSSLFMAGTTFEYTFDEAGTYDYFCMVHPWMKGTVTVG
ncbi:MAG: plastocyanin/azurin family copper-binding protein [Nitrosopumilaceae archaeon]